MSNFQMFTLDDDAMDTGEPKEGPALRELEKKSSPDQDLEDSDGWEDVTMNDPDFKEEAGEDEEVDEDEDEDEDDGSTESKPKHKRAKVQGRRRKRTTLLAQTDTTNSFVLLDDGPTDEGKKSQPSRALGTFGRRPNLPRISHTRRITAELDSDDELIITMRDKGYSDQQIADHLSKEGRTRYERKSVATRIGRIKLAQAKNIDNLLEQGLKEWKYEDDVRLLEAYALADVQVNYEIERARAWRFKKVSDQMRRADKDCIFSEKACRDRYQALMNGTAKIPTALDDDPEARRKEVEALHQKQEEKQAAEALKMQKKAEKEQTFRDKQLERSAEKAKAAATMQAARLKENVERSLKRAQEAQLKLQRAEDNRIARDKQLADVRARKVAAKDGKVKQTHNENPNPSFSLKEDTEKASKSANDGPSTPRSALSMKHLQELCRRRYLPEEAQTTQELVKRLEDADNKCSLQQLKTECRSRGLNVTGNKSDLRRQLAVADAKLFASESEERA
ncbi:hypothetical protein BU24DRAFT_480872 [Aaosphaeria arxii CBS 175.79]|uniref:SAP domain-containing protein n=1 Tax=Aaosphaeria arxii CBS 175.79 TaxID=1450172 RepID=A0A6A5XSW1_9PLEO|nr:uncharacterized protein BU24DRAFT_480872 [Aaosphaeria arxii CBS 175.79]KAF2016282.1 hypothetical protein BU24DRAFT_480872 [Aaosphaeria arxii CBS 175.79]